MFKHRQRENMCIFSRPRITLHRSATFEKFRKIFCHTNKMGRMNTKQVKQRNPFGSVRFWWSHILKGSLPNNLLVVGRGQSEERRR